MREQIEKRLAELQAEYSRGQEVAAQMEQERINLQQTLLRISGAIQLCHELLTQPAAAQPAPAETEVDHDVDN